MKLALRITDGAVRVASCPEALRDRSSLIVWPLSAHIRDRVGQIIFPLGEVQVYEAVLRWSPTGRYRFGDYQKYGWMTVTRDRQHVGAVCVERVKQFLLRPFRDIRGRRFNVSFRRVA